MPDYSWTLSIPAAEAGPPAAAFAFADEAAGPPPDFGFDITTLPDLDTTFTPRRDFVVLADAYARRLFTPRGSLWSDPNYGFDVRDFLHDEISQGTLAAIRSGAEAQAEQDERLGEVVIDVAYNFNTETLILKAAVYSASGPFALVLSVTDVRADIFVQQEG